MDPQASLARAFGRQDDADRLYNALIRRAGLPVDELADGLTLSSSSFQLSRAETELISEPGREHFLRACFEQTIEPCIANERRASNGSPAHKGPLHVRRAADCWSNSTNRRTRPPRALMEELLP